MPRPSAAPENTVIQTPDGGYQVKRNGAWVPSNAQGQPTAAPLSGAPDTVGRRQEYMAGMKQIGTDLAGLRRADGLFTSFNDFEAANRSSATGAPRGWPVVGPVINLFDQQNTADMNAAASRIQTGGVPQGQGAVSDYERRLYAMGSPTIEARGPTNASLIANARAMRAQEADRVAFMQDYIARNGTLNGADEKWRGYVAANPYVRRQPIAGGGTQAFLIERRTPWRQFFGGPASPASPAATPTAPRPATPAATTPQAALPAAARAQLREGQNITFGNGQTWTLRAGKPVRLR